jgi:hypothetical protein
MSTGSAHKQLIVTSYTPVYMQNLSCTASIASAATSFPQLMIALTACAIGKLSSSNSVISMLRCPLTTKQHKCTSHSTQELCIVPELAAAAAAELLVLQHALQPSRSTQLHCQQLVPSCVQYTHESKHTMQQAVRHCVR